MKNNRKNVVAVLTLILLSCLGYIFFSGFIYEKGSYAVIKKDGEIISKISLANDIENFKVEGAGDMIFTINNGEISVTYSDCPDKICVKTGSISRKGEMAVCLPNRISVEITDSNSDESVDFIVQGR